MPVLVDNDAVFYSAAAFSFCSASGEIPEVGISLTYITIFYASHLRIHGDHECKNGGAFYLAFVCGTTFLVFALKSPTSHMPTNYKDNYMAMSSSKSPSLFFYETTFTFTPSP